MSAQQEVMKHFMGALDKTPLKGEAALDAAVRACSEFDGIDDLIESFISDCEHAVDSDTFLREKCGIILGNEDIGAITGSDAGGSTTKTRDSIVPEEGTSEYPPSSTFEINGLTVHVPERETLTDAQQTIVKGLYTWWIGGALDLIAESYGDRYSFNESSSATVREITVEFADSGSFLAQVGHRYQTSSGKATSLLLQINMRYYGSVSASNVNGKSTNLTASYLDRVLAHEFTHGVMAANVNNFYALPGYIKEGIAEITHGIDDTRRSSITALARDTTKLRQALSSSVGTVQISGVTAPTYAAGYMLMRYLAEQGAPTIESRAENYSYIALSDGDDSLDNYEDSITLALGAGDDTIKNYSSDVTIAAGSGNDLIVDEGSGTVIKLDSMLRRVTVDDDDLIFSLSDGAITLDGAADSELTVINSSDELVVKNFSADTLDGGGESVIYNADGLKINRAKTKLTVGDPFEGVIDCADFSTKLKTIDARKDTHELELIGNDRNNILRAGSGGATLDGGAGNDKLYGGAGVDTFIYNGGKDWIYNYEAGEMIVVEEPIDSVKISGKNVKLMFGKEYLGIKKAVGLELALTDSDGEVNYYVFDKTHKTFETALIDRSHSDD